ncbi:MAG: glycosyltransferase family 2 protein [Xanthobacteraceae bacterium]|nr:glycosyltransferase [Xanthobacteraceae bacterium]
MAFGPSGNSSSNIGTGEAREVRESSLPTVQSGFAEQTALFRTATDLPVELRALRDHVDPMFLRWAASRAEMLGIPADAIVRRSGVLHADAMLEIYAAHLGTAIDPLDDHFETTRSTEKILSSGVLLERAQDGRNLATIALSGGNTKVLCERIGQNPALAGRIRITSSERLRAFLQRSNAANLAEDAAFGLIERQPSLSAGASRYTQYWLAPLCIVGTAVLAIYAAPKLSLLAIEAVLATIFIAWAALRIYACLTPASADARHEIPERELPIYTILVPLYREAGIVPDLVNALSALNYPREKLDIKLILEPDDIETARAIGAINLDPCFEVVVVPEPGPRTKPKALRAALPFARGEFLVIYDAEDRPHASQLRDAYARFLEGHENLACVQARLAIDNTYPSFLTAHFRAEYSGLFDVLLPAIARLRLPVPLGGTSNHFRTEVLRAVGGWDPHNVTEDADLGIRLARFGYTTNVVDSTTWEEAPSRLGAWLPQRTRWMKGWLQTYLVHMRDPLLLLKQLKWRGFLAFQLLIGGSVLAALVHPLFFAWLLLDTAFGSLLSPATSALQGSQKGLAFATLASGYIASAVLAFVGMRRRGAITSAWVLLTIPVYWLLLSAAAWRAVWKLVVAPYQWEKTAHGVAPRRPMR